MEWIAENKGWLISSRRNKQVQQGGDNSTNIQVGGNLSLGGKKDYE